MKLIILFLLFSLSLSANNECLKFNSSKEAPKWAKNVKALVKLDNEYYFQSNDKQKSQGDEITTGNSVWKSKNRMITLLKKYVKIVEDYSSNYILDYDSYKVKKLIDKLIPKAQECWLDPKTKDVYSLFRLKLKFVNNLYPNEKFELHQEIINELNLFAKNNYSDEMLKYPIRKKLKLNNKPDWVTKGIFITKNKIYVTGFDKLNTSYRMAKSMSKDNARLVLSSLFKLKVTVNMAKEKGSSSSGGSISNKTIYLKSELASRWIDAENGVIYSLLEADIDYINKKNDNILSDELVKLIKNYKLNTSKSPSSPAWTKDKLKIIRKDGKDFYQILGYSDYLGDMAMTFTNAKDDALQKITMHLTKGNEKTKDGNGKLLTSYKFSVSLNVVGALVINKWINLKTKEVYVLLELSKELLDKYNK